jgi:ribosomal protein L40E
MAFFDKMKDSLSLAGQGVSQKAKTVSETTKINGQIKSNEKMIEKLIYQVGVQCVNNHINEENTEYSELFKEILRLRSENKEHQEMIKKLNTAKICPQCNFTNNSAAKFCVSCGAPLNVAPAPKPVDGKICPKCGSVNSEESMFCVECGTHLEAASAEATPVTEPVEPATVIEPDQTSAESNKASEIPEESVLDVQTEDLKTSETSVESEDTIISQEEEITDATEEARTQAADETAASSFLADDAPVVEEGANNVQVCKVCGAVLTEGALFCVECGTKIAD